MVPFDSRSPCACDALSCATPLTITGGTVGITGFCDSIEDVRLRGLRDDAWIRSAIIKGGERTRHIPSPLRDDYADALPLSSDITEKKNGIRAGE